MFGTEGSGKEVYEHPLISEPSCIGHNYSNIDLREDLFKLKVDYPFNHLVQLALIAIGDPGVMADVYRLKYFKHRFQELQVQHSTMREFRNWYRQAWDASHETYALLPNTDNIYQSFCNFYLAHLQI